MVANQISQPGCSVADWMVTGVPIAMGFAAASSAGPGETLETRSARCIAIDCLQYTQSIS